MRIQSGQMIPLGYGRYVRSDDVIAVEAITEGRGPGRRSLVWVRGLPDPFISSRSEAAIVADLIRPAEAARATAANLAQLRQEREPGFVARMRGLVGSANAEARDAKSPARHAR